MTPEQLDRVATSAQRICVIRKWLKDIQTQLSDSGGYTPMFAWGESRRHVQLDFLTDDDRAQLARLIRMFVESRRAAFLEELDTLTPEDLIADK